MMDKKSLINKTSELFQKKHLHIYALIGISILSFGLNFYAISQTGYGNAYYAAAIRSMTQSFKNFFFVAFDPAGMVSVDKPPLALWVQALFVMVFGYHGWVMLLPQALAGTGSCIMMYVLVGKHFGRPAGLISALVFALTPAVVVASRNNTMDMQLIFVLLLATWFLFQAIEKSKWHYLFLAALFIGLGFNIKMLQAYMILPAVGLMYLIFSKEKISRRIFASVISIGIMLAVSFAWVVAVDLYPASDRPYVGSSTNNTETELIIGHNGLERIYGQGGAGGAGRGTDGFRGDGMRPDGKGTGNQPPQMNRQNGTANNGVPPVKPQDGGSAGNASNQNGAPPNGQGRNQTGFPGRGAGGAVGNDIGTAGVLRLWTNSMYGQASWLIVFALFCILANIRKFNLKELTLKQGVFFYWVIWLLTMVGFFSFASFYHRYYLCMLAPGIAGLSGIGLAAMFKAFRDKDGWRQWLLPLSLIATSAIGIVYVWSYPALRTWLVPIIASTAVISLILMAIYRFSAKRVALLAATGLMLISILAGSFYWALTVVIYVPENVTMPYAGPELASQTKTPGMTSNQEAYTSLDSKGLALEKYLVAHYKEGSYLVVSQRANDVAGFIVDTGLPAVAYGGFLGSDQALTLDKLKQLVKEGKVTYFLLSEQGGFGGGSNSELSSYVKANATLIDPTEYGATSSQSGNSGRQSGSALYCFKS